MSIIYFITKCIICIQKTKDEEYFCHNYVNCSVKILKKTDMITLDLSKNERCECSYFTNYELLYDSPHIFMGDTKKKTEIQDHKRKTMK